MTQLVFTVHATPAPQGSKTPRVSKKGKPYMTESSDRIKSWRGRVTEEAEAAIYAWVGPGHWARMEGPVVLSAVFTFARPAGHYGSGRNAGKLKPSAPARPIAHNLGDLDKLLRGVCDGLTDAGVWADDSQVTDIYSAKVYPGGHTYAQRVPGVYVVVTGISGSVVGADPIMKVTERMLQLMIVKLAGVLPTDDDKNGLAVDSAKLLGEGPKKTFLVVALVSGGTSKLDYDKDETVLTLRIRHVEVVPEDHRSIVAESLFQALQARTGAMMLPVEPGEEYDPASDDE